MSTILIIFTIFVILDTIAILRLFSSKLVAHKILFMLFYLLSDAFMLIMIMTNFSLLILFFSLHSVNSSNFDAGSMAIKGLTTIITPIFSLLTIIYINKLNSIHAWLLYGKHYKEKQIIDLLQNFWQHPTKKSINYIAKKIKKLKHSEDLTQFINTIKEKLSTNNVNQAKTISQNLIHYIETQIQFYSGKSD